MNVFLTSNNIPMLIFGEEKEKLDMKTQEAK